MPVFYGDLVYEFKIIVEKAIFCYQCKKSIKRYQKAGYNMVIMPQSACPVVNPITVCSYDFLLNCTTAGQSSDSMTILT